MSLSYDCAGTGDPMVVLPGFAAAGTLWPRAWLGALATEFTVITPSHRGTGGSSPPAGRFGTTDMADDVAAVLDDCGAGRAHVVGHSMGGLVAQALAVRHPARVGRLALVSSAAGMAEGDDTPGEPPRLPSFREHRTPFDLWCSMAAPGFEERSPDARRDLEADLPLAPVGVTTLLTQLRCVAQHPAPTAAAIDRPVLVLHGDRDRVVPVRLGRALAGTIPGARYHELAGIGHLPPWEIPHECADEILGFCTAAG